MKTSLIITLIFSVALGSMAQDRKPKWDISVSYGLALPIGDFKQTAPAKSMKGFLSSTSGPGQFYYDVFGIAKDGNSYATSGQFGALSVNYHIGRQWLMALAIHHSRNSVNTQPFYDYINTVVFPKVSMVSNNDYNVTAWSTGFGYEFYHKQFRLTLIPVIGQAEISSPDYSFEWFTYPWNFDVIKLGTSLLLGLHGNIGYKFGSRFYTALKADFDSANFEYKIIRRSPGTTYLFLDDRITYRLLKIGLTVGIRL